MATTYQEVWDPITKAANPNTIQATLDDGTVQWIPNDPMNKDWQEYEVWLGEGNTPTPASAPASPTQPISS